MSNEETVATTPEPRNFEVNGYGTSGHSNKLINLFGALAAAKAEFPPIPKNKKNPFFESYYSSLEDVYAAVNPILAKNGLTIVQFPGTIEQGANGPTPSLTTWLFHESGEYIWESAVLALAKKDPQAQGSGITYLRRYSVKSILGLEDGEADDDGNAATHENVKVNPTNELNTARDEFKRAAKAKGMNSDAAKTWWTENGFKGSALTTKSIEDLRAAIVKLA